MNALAHPALAAGVRAHGVARFVRIPDLRPACQSVALGVRGEVVLPVQAAAGVPAHVLVPRVPAARQRACLARGRASGSRCAPSSSALAVAIPAGYALARLRLPWRGAMLLAFPLPQAVPNLPVYVNIARVFYEIGLERNDCPASCWSTRRTGSCSPCGSPSAAFAAVDASLEEAARNMGASPWTCFRTVTLPLAAPGLVASAIFVFLESLDEFTGAYFVGVPDVITLPLLMFNASMGGNYQIASITALLLLIPSIGFMLVVERFLKADVLAMVGRLTGPCARSPRRIRIALRAGRPGRRRCAHIPFFGSTKQEHGK